MDLVLVQEVDFEILVTGETQGETRYCEHFNRTACTSEADCRGERRECDLSHPDKRSHCFVIWKTTRQGEHEVLMKVGGPSSPKKPFSD